MDEPRKNALITGASTGVGQGIAIGLARAGWAVGLNYFDDGDRVKETAASVEAWGGSCWMIQADVGDAEQVRSMFRIFDREVGQLDLMVNNAGVQTWAPLLELKEEDWDRTIRTNLKGTFLCTQEAGRRMRDNGGGCIINIGSGANKAPFPNLADYCASKGGIERLTAVSAVEFGPLGIRVNCVAPGCTEVERTRRENPDYARLWGDMTPMRRIGNVDDVANAVNFLASDGAEFITGQTIYVDGALWSQIPWPYATE